MKTDVLMWGLFTSSAMEAAIHLEEHELRGNPEFIPSHSEVDIGRF